MINNYANSTKVMVLDIRMNIACLESWSTMTRIVLNVMT